MARFRVSMCEVVAGAMASACVRSARSTGPKQVKTTNKFLLHTTRTRTLNACIKSLFICAICVICVKQNAEAQTLADYDYENLTFRGIGVDYGLIWPSKVDRTGAYSLRLDLGFLGPGVRVSPSVTYWS